MISTAGGGILSSIRIRGARVHNLKSIDLDIPHNQITVITGVSGSGKSSFAFDTLFAEGQRQYLDSLSAYARQFLDQLPRPDVDVVEGLQPTLCIDQKTGATHPRSTVATVTEIYDYLRLLYARVGIPHCVGCGEAVAKRSADQVVAALAEIPAETSVVLLAPMVRGRKGTHQEVFEQIRRNGWVRARVDGVIHGIDELPELAPRKLHTIEAVVDRLVVRPGNETRLSESARLALRTGDGVMTVLSTPDRTRPDADWEERLFSTLSACPGCGRSFEELEPRSFSFNSPYGACPRCDGLGTAVGEACPDCRGGRLRPEALAVTIADRNVAESTSLSVRAAIDWFQRLCQRVDPLLRVVAERVVDEIVRRLRFLDSVGLHYLTLDRAAATLSGGEHQRVRLATSLGSGLVGVCYVLDEPSIGLHPVDNQRLIDSLRSLSKQGNTVVVVEHDEAMMRAADRLVDFGPGAGPRGGRVISQGSPDDVARDPASLTGGYLNGTRSCPVPEQRRVPRDDRWVELVGARTNNLKDVTARFPLGMLVGVTGVSGSGKSSLVNDTLIPAIESRIRELALIKANEYAAKVAEAPSAYRTRRKGKIAASADEITAADDDADPQDGVVGPQAKFAALLGAESVEKLIRIDQRPIGRGPRSCPATYSGVLGEIRSVFAATREAKQKGFTASRFSFNAAAGRCDGCQGQGVQKIEMNFLSDLFVVCPRCGGKRYNRQTLAVQFKGRSIADVLDMTIEEATDFFENFSRIRHLLASLRDIGLGYLKLGQPSTTLSGGEAQRIKLGTELARPPRGHTLYVLDEPTTGLHFEDVARLIRVLGGLVETDGTVIVIEHNLEVIRACDWLIEIGPGGGEEGGQIVATGTPEGLARHRGSATGKYLAESLRRRR
jgi:excinuclease ABC subunit A